MFDKKAQKAFKVLGIVIAVLVILSMLLLYFPALSGGGNAVPF